MVCAQSDLGNVLFWTAQDWECDYFEIKIYTVDSNILAQGKLKEKYTENTLPECGNEQVLNFQDLAEKDYFFIADCSKEACYVCNGEGSYWQPTVQTEAQPKNARKNKGQIGGVYKTCHTCGGNGEAFQILWIDTFSIHPEKCRTILLK